MRGNGGLDQSSSNASKKNSLDIGCILTCALIRLSNELEIKCEGERELWLNWVTERMELPFTELENIDTGADVGWG